ncbi:MAG: tRNA epoxyqueuosine(34) reductase QueG [Alphaproteobacteria bacterium]|nr:tRNA epoxyqueuosine(34) reductase QueG [Alphaproteobacteria bacterium]HPF46032.1 tRNA epoxyqueuosine(34) reductase QueG [Emcibacteraceae bacterium]HRW28798.1 tRNA epoxyqueuosine(34) reductase QueG [Emcibacteraceae bacterium]
MSDTLLPETSKSAIISFALKTGFDVVKITDPYGLEKNAGFFTKYLKQSFHGDMKWMEEKADRRKSPLTLWPEVKSIIMVGMNYGPGENPLDFLANKNIGNISVYARGRDYHDVVKKRLKQIARYIHQEYKAEVKVFVDTAPVLEKPLAAKAGLGWQGKHTNLVSRDFGSWLFIGSIFTTLKISPDSNEPDHCGTCRSCLDICPTNAFPGPYQLDARRCISYLTIEYKGHIDEEFRAAMGNRIYGCDDCLSVCPWNKYALRTKEHSFLPRSELKYPKLLELAQLDEPSFREIFSGSPIKRIGRDFFIRNVIIAIGNSGNKSSLPLLKEKLTEKSPHIRAMAIWALKRLTNEDEFNHIKNKCAKSEHDPDVLKEWR